MCCLVLNSLVCFTEKASQKTQQNRVGERSSRLVFEGTDDQRDESETDANTDQDESFSLTDAVVQV